MVDSVTNADILRKNPKITLSKTINNHTFVLGWSRSSQCYYVRHTDNSIQVSVLYYEAYREALNKYNNLIKEHSND